MCRFSVLIVLLLHQIYFNLSLVFVCLFLMKQISVSKCESPSSCLWPSEVFLPVAANRRTFEEKERMLMAPTGVGQRERGDAAGTDLKFCDCCIKERIVIQLYDRTYCSIFGPVQKLQIVQFS